MRFTLTRSSRAGVQVCLIAIACAGFICIGTASVAAQQQSDGLFVAAPDVGYGLIVLTSATELVGAGRGFQVVIAPSAAGAPRVHVGSVDEGTFVDGCWVAGRRLNGDESDQNHKWRFAPGKLSISRCVVYAFE